MSENNIEKKIRRNISLNIEDMSVRIAEHYGTHRDGDYEEVKAETYSLDALPHNIRQVAECHGLAQKLSDTTAGMSDAKGHTTEERFEKIDELFEQLKGGDWNKKSEGAGPKFSKKQIAQKLETMELPEGMTQEQFDLAKQAMQKAGFC